ncbi:hypothetical protein [Dethiosulfatarculus sandiegensis]|uniref:Uncharacterized protein n=1 Tax=Dethiosulfatarculus sandiegensis TaxID=1429043 RepID=A0A0D2HNW6_9BACT|nr:hypothetical protein [Dethiosulfatarculus sandiegensis]KIX12253.1 hypothetical protein X474_19745 [Dethiosulfatarculus sandiegensis]
MMRAENWHDLFFEVINSNDCDANTATETTEFMQKVFGRMAKKAGTKLACRNQKRDDTSAEYLSIDATFLDYWDEQIEKEWPIYKPLAVVEHENENNMSKILWCLWKLLNVKAGVKILIIYRKNRSDAEQVVSRIENYICRGAMQPDLNEELLVIIGQEDLACDGISWEKYFLVFEWQGAGFKDYTQRTWA